MCALAFDIIPRIYFKHLRLKLGSSHCVPQITVEKILEHVTWRVLEGSCWVGELFNGDSLKTHNY